MNNYGGFWLEGLGNAAFIENYRLWVPALREGGFTDVQIGDRVVFADKDEHGKLQECIGLKHLIWTEWSGKPVVIVDNHNHVFYFWYIALLGGLIKDGCGLVHVDQHKDTRIPDFMLPNRDLKTVFGYTNDVLNVGNYIIPAQNDGLIGDIKFVTGEADLVGDELIGETNKILNLDLDFFAPELDYIDFNKTKSFILAHARESALITIATSPYFIDQDRAISKLHELFEAQ